MLHTRVPFYVLAVAAAGIFAVSQTWHRWGPRIVINSTPSEPTGFYRVEPRRAEQIHPGMYVVFPVPVAFRALVYGHRWIRPGVPFLKTVVAVAGDRVCVDEDSFAVNGRPLGPVYDSDGRGTVLPRLRGCFVVPAGYFFPASTYNPRSFDGRYMGPQPVSAIEGEAKPLWTF